MVTTTKTRWKTGQSYQLLVPANATPQYCPVKGWRDYHNQQRPRPIGPAIITPTGAPLLPAALTVALRMALAAAGTSHPASNTLHSLRRGGAQACAVAGDSLQDIMALGSWSSAAVHTYVPKEQIQTGLRTLSNLLG